jgi:glycosyltransferase involved in cell wall biosynthesis
MPHISVLMANYNKETYIEAAIESVQSQTFPDWELIIVDDGSRDGSLQRIERFLSDPRIKLFVRPSNGGYTKALIYGFEQVSSGIVGILDSDDALVEDALSTVYAAHAEDQDLGLVLSQVIICDSELKPLYTTATTPEHIREPLLWLRGSTAFRCFKMAAYARTAGLDVRMQSGEDSDLLFKLEEVARVRRIDRPLYLYRQLPSSMSKDARSYNVTYSCIAWAIYRAHWRRMGTTTPNLPKPVVEAWLLAGIRYSLELGAPLRALRFAARAMRTGGLVGPARRVLGAAVRAFELARRRRTDIRLAATGRARYYPVREFQSNTGNVEPDRIRCIPLIHKPGHCLFGGDYQIVRSGRYRASFEIEARCPSFVLEPVLTLDVHENGRGGGVLAERGVGRAELARSLEFLAVEFEAAEGDRVEFRVLWAGQCALSVTGVVFEELGPASADRPG